jgi:DNA-binding CsgD family transcriptional regulator
MDTSIVANAVLQKIEGIAECRTEYEVTAVAKDVVEMLGASWFVYLSQLPPERFNDVDNFKYLIGCDPEFCRLYDQRKWMMNDPFIDYARSNLLPILRTQIKPLTKGQEELLDACTKYGFRSGLVIPTHTSMEASKRIGLLYIGSSLPIEIGEPLLLRSRLLFSALASELLMWHCRFLKSEAMRQLSLVEEEVKILQLSKNGKAASEISAIMNIPRSKVYQRISVIKDKFSVERIEHAVMQAASRGLLG